MRDLTGAILWVLVSWSCAAVAQPADPKGWDPDFTRPELVGASADGRQLAIRFVDVSGGEACYPKIGGRQVYGVLLARCAARGGCEEGWVVYPQHACDRSGAKEALARAKGSFRRAGVDLGLAALSLEVRKRGEGGRIALPASLCRTLGLRSAAELRFATRYISGSVGEPDQVEFGFHLHAEGLGATRAGTIRLRYAGGGGLNLFAATSPDGRVVAFFVRASLSGFRWGAGGVRLRAAAARLFNDRGYEAHKRGDFESSAADFEQALRLEPAYGQAAFNLACALARQGAAAPALDALGKAVEIDRLRFAPKACRDADLKTVRGHARFKALLGRGCD